MSAADTKHKFPAATSWGSFVDGRNKVTAQGVVHTSTTAIHDDDERLLARIGYRQVRDTLRLPEIMLTTDRSCVASLRSGRPFLTLSLSLVC
jgi:hypothetical protein